MKKVFLFLLIIPFFGLVGFSQTGSVGIGTTNPNTSAALEIQSTTKGILIPRMTTIQRNAISSPATGLMVYDNTTNSFWFKSATDWVEVSDTANNVWRKNGTSAYVNVPDNVGIGTNIPQYHLDINKPNASIGLTDAQTSQFSGSITGNAGDLNIIASRVLLGQGTPGDVILQNSSGFAAAGNVGIGTTTPFYKLDVNGDSRITGNTRIQEHLVVEGSQTIMGNIQIHGTTNLFGPAYATENLSVSENLTVNGGKGIVRSGNTLQLTVVFPNGAIGFTNAPPGHSQDVIFNMPDVFAGNPLISVAQVLNQTGSFEQWVATIHTIDIVNDQFTVRFYNAGSTNSTMSATYRFIAIGAAL
jgi:hypothetical protein